MTEVENKVTENKKRRTVAEPKVSVTLKRLWKAEGAGLSLKQFARLRKKSGDAIAKRWFENASGKHNAKRSEKNAGLAKLIGEAVKLGRKKSSTKK
jgi:hypothetical protein